MRNCVKISNYGRIIRENCRQRRNFFMLYLTGKSFGYQLELMIKLRVKEVYLKGKAVPLHATKALGERRYSSYSYSTSVLDGVNGQRHAPVAVYPRGKDPRYPLYRGWVGSRAGLDKEAIGKILCPCRGSKPDRPVVQPVVRCCTDWATPAHERSISVPRILIHHLYPLKSQRGLY
jgi:hypothetical protein